MSKYKDTSQSVDILLQLLALGTITGAMLIAPNAVQILDKPLDLLLNKIDDREKQRKLSRLRSYMKAQGLVRGDYDHGIELTKKALRRIKLLEYKNIKIESPKKWDNKWRLVMFDIPESKRSARVGFTNKIHSLGYQILQQSVWIHPYDSKDVIAKTVEHFGISEWVTYLEVEEIAQQEKLIIRFRHLKLV